MLEIYDFSKIRLFRAKSRLSIALQRFLDFARNKRM